MPGNSSGASFIKIPGNIKQAMSPFVLNPSISINSTKTDSTELNGASPQFFSFRPSKVKTQKGILNICPSSFKNFMSDDISYKLLFARNAETGEMKKESITSDVILDSIPAIQIREFLPDTALNQIINFVTAMMETVDALKVAIKDMQDASATKGTKQEVKNGEAQGKTDDFTQKLFKAATWVIQYLTGSVKDNLITDIKDFFEDAGAVKYYKNAGNDNFKNYVLNFPYVMYYKFLSSVTTNLYEVPCAPSGNVMYSSDGAPGWGAGGIDLLWGPLANVDLFKTFFGNIRVHYMKTWDAKEGSSTTGDSISMSFDLFNDSDEAAINNFIFVNTLIANNKWIQYNIFEHAPALYDIKIEGYNRLFACTGKFKVSYKGVLRDIPQKLANDLATTYKGSLASFDDKVLIKQKLVKIPDIYTVEMQFDSCLPQNFNTFLFQYSNNTNQIEEYKEKETSYQPSIVTDMMSKGIKNFATKFADYWPNGNFPTS